MNSIAIVTDSTADLPQSLIDELNINIIPVKIQIGSTVYKDGIDFSSEEFYRKSREGCKDFNVIQPAPTEFMELYKELAKEHDQIISIHIGSNYSGTISSANIAKTMLGSEHNITVIDSHLVSMALGVLVVEAGRAVKANLHLSEVLEILSHKKETIQGYFLAEGDCIFTNVFKENQKSDDLYNVFKLVQGDLTHIEGHRNKTKALQNLIEIIDTQFEKKKKYKIAIIHCDSLEDAVKLRDLVDDSITYDELIISEMSSAVGAHIGLGSIGIVIYPA